MKEMKSNINDRANKTSEKKDRYKVLKERKEEGKCRAGLQSRNDRAKLPHHLCVYTVTKL